MRISKERKVYVVLVGAALIGLGVVLLASKSGATVTAGAANAVDPEVKPVAKGTTEPADGGGEVRSLATRLKSFEKSHNLEMAGDAFKPSSIWAIAKPKAEAAVVTARAVDTFKGAHQLTAVLVAGSKSQAIVDGRTVSLGQSLDGYRLVSVTSKTAAFAGAGNIVVLHVPSPEQVAAVEVR